MKTFARRFVCCLILFFFFRTDDLQEIEPAVSKSIDNSAPQTGFHCRVCRQLLFVDRDLDSHSVIPKEFFVPLFGVNCSEDRSKHFTTAPLAACDNASDPIISTSSSTNSPLLDPVSTTENGSTTTQSLENGNLTMDPSASIPSKSSASGDDMTFSGEPEHKEDVQGASANAPHAETARSPLPASDQQSPSPPPNSHEVCFYNIILAFVLLLCLGDKILSILRVL